MTNHSDRYISTMKCLITEINFIYDRPDEFPPNFFTYTKMINILNHRLSEFHDLRNELKLRN